MIQTNYNPDVLSCLANLSNDEVFTPPGLVNNMLDLLPTALWSNPDAKFLDPVSKSGVFLREIAKRLMLGLEKKIPDKQKRINHIFENQLYGIAITELTALLSRRSVYCSKTANGKYAVCETFTNEQGNIRYERMQHTWQNGKCTYCGASQEVYDREEALESYAYNFIHTENPETIFNMYFDVIIGNPPYQLSDGGAQMSASPIYHKFIQQAKKLNPNYLCMIIPARWYSGGKGLDEFRDEMLKDSRMQVLHDFHETSDVFPGLNIRGGICYFLWNKDYKGDCEVINHNKGETISATRPLLEKSANIFVRYNQAMSILKKVQKQNEKPFSIFVSSRKPFGLATNVRGEKVKDKESIRLYQNGGIAYINKDKVLINRQWIKDWKVIIPYSSPGDDSFPHLILSKPIIAEPNSACTETYLVIGPFANETICKNVSIYLRSRFTRFLILLLKPTQHVTSKTYGFVPIQDFTEPWTDEKLYKKYGLTQDEIDYIESMIRPMDVSQSEE
ncbi:MAG: Eco57I restriction-modification methylase domain-containing protein [Bacteroidetes bacterium]|nr:Eco57I restriction-modification methylase domain-containing protein [Bacteroidota bacterium]